VPSMHCAFALMIAVPGVMLSRHLWAKAFWAVYPLIVLWVVVVTANHYWVDAAIGAIVAAVAALVAQRLLARARPAAWSFGPIPGHARA
jgi:membrane-associated phospholipid phosphatase